MNPSLGNLTIPAGAALASNAIDLLDFLESLTFFCPALAGVTTVQVSPKNVADSVTADYITLQRGGADVALPSGKAYTLTDLSFGSLRLKEAGSPGADEVIQLVGYERAYTAR